jgi:hypothetical protein
MIIFPQVQLQPTGEAEQHLVAGLVR